MALTECTITAGGTYHGTYYIYVCLISYVRVVCLCACGTGRYFAHAAGMLQLLRVKPVPAEMSSSTQRRQMAEQVTLTLLTVLTVLTLYV